MVSTIVRTLRPLRVDLLLVDNHQFPVFAGIWWRLRQDTLTEATQRIRRSPSPLI